MRVQILLSVTCVAFWVGCAFKETPLAGLHAFNAAIFMFWAGFEIAEWKRERRDRAGRKDQS